MKRIVLSIIFTIFCIYTNAQYNCVVTSSDRESVTFRVVGYGSNIKKATTDAEISAIKTICFIGAVGTTYSIPMIPVSENIAVADNSAFFKSFYSELYRNFIESSFAISKFGKDASKRKCQTFKVKIRAEQLRRYLEQNNVIRRFGL